ncbi:peroxidase-like protein 3 isoform X2 [Eurytemora carolleeae]|nr:peroxidase-like protein 3 isoform X2 [Eurytemora carolleeae]|eukprot:XP_023326856.1 peroxidase-like protein 3 isoform X2 [Eurytemora affinis]
MAEIQWITFKEFLPLVIGKSGMEQYDINLDASKYDPQTDPGIINSFATAAFRFGHSLVQSIFKGKNQPWKLGEFYGNASFATDNNGENFTNELVGLSKQPCQNADVHITNEMTHFLFCNEKTEGGGGHDIAAINIQRGRDHGIPGYQEFRRLCGLEELESLEITPEGVDPASWRKIQSVYGSVDEIDLFVGGLAELPTQDGLIGPTFSCIIGRQFKALMEGDRFFFHHTDGPGIRPLTGSALEEIKQRSLASIICESTSISVLAKHVFIQIGRDNEIVPCNQHIPLNLENIINEIIT